jgi:hypothetical protein
MHISFALKSLGITQYTLDGSPTTEADFINAFKKVASIDSEGNPTFTDNWGFTWSELQSEVARLQAEEDAKQYQVNRAAEYPPMSDYLDGLVKGDQAQIDKYIADCLAVKLKYPKD